MMFNRWFLLLVLLLLHEVKGTMVKLNNGGFENIVVAINPELHEDQKIVDNIKDMVKEGSRYVFNATQQRFYFKTVKIIIPLTWTKKHGYKRITMESYEKADVIVADPFLKYGDDPYTLQYGGCREQGRYIHFTPNFLTNDKLVNAYGPRGRVFVHEWAHLRWGIFDEYNNDAPFYVTGKNKAEATRCSADITGKYVFQTSTGKIRTCKVEHQTGLYEDGCQFVPEKKQRTSASVMYMQGLFSVTQFCNQSKHNIWATNMQNKLCDLRSTWEVIMDSADFAGSSPIAAPPPAPTFSLLQAHERVLCLVLDVSGSMNWYNQINRLRQAAEVFLLQIIEKGSWVGIVTFESTAKIATGLQQIVSDRVRKSLTKYLPIKAGGGTKICSGVHAGFQVFLQKYTSTEGCEIVLLTDGEDSTVQNCIGEITSRGAIVHTIALGPRAARELEVLSSVTGGLKFLATNNLDSNGLIDAFSGISSGNGNISQQSIQLESRSQSISAGEWLDGVVSIDKSVGNDTFFVVTWSKSTSPPEISLRDPKGQSYCNTDFVIENTNVRTARLKIYGTAEVGDWTYKIQNTYPMAQVISMIVTTRAASLTEPPVIVKPYLSRDSNTYPNPMIIYAEVNQGFLPVIGAKVTATVEPESGTAVELKLLDNGAGADILKHDGIYSRYFTSFTENGRYNVKVHVQGQEKTVRHVHRQNQALYVPGYIEEDGVIKLNPPRHEVADDDIQANLRNFSRIASGGSFVMANIPCGGPRDVFPPSKITDLEAESAEDDKFFLSWTAPGNDFDSGKAERYEIKMSEDPLELRNATFRRAISVNTSGLTPAAAGTRQSFQFKSESSIKENGTTIFFAIRAIDNSNNVGEASNIARAVLSMTPLPITLPPSTGDRTLPPSTADRTLPPSTTDRTLPPSTTDMTLPPSIGDRTLPPSTTDMTLPPSIGDRTLPPSTTDRTLPPSTADATLPPSTADVTLPPSPADATLPSSPADRTLPSSPADMTLPPSTAGRTLPPSTAGRTLPPSTLDRTLLLSTADRTLTPSTAETTLLPISADRTLLPITADMTLSPGTADRTLSPGTADRTLTPSTADMTLPLSTADRTLLPSTADTASATTHSNLETTVTTVSHNENSNTLVIVIVASVCAVIIISAIVTITVCFAQKRKTGMYNPEIAV